MTAEIQMAGQVALVTGASRGIGYALALTLARAGAHVVAMARTVGGLEELDDAVRAAGSSATLVPLDMRDYDGFYRLAAALNAFGVSTRDMMAIFQTLKRSGALQAELIIN